MSARRPTRSSSVWRPGCFRLVDRTRGGVSVHGFFLLERAIFPSPVGFFLTYFVVLLEFRLGGGEVISALVEYYFPGDSM